MDTLPIKYQELSDLCWDIVQNATEALGDPDYAIVDSTLVMTLKELLLEQEEEDEI